MLLPELREQLARYACKMYESGLVRATQGNLSARNPEDYQSERLTEGTSSPSGERKLDAQASFLTESKHGRGSVVGARNTEDPQHGLICITPTGADYQSLTAEDIVVVDEQGTIVEGRWQPSVETPLHTLILRHRRDIHCVMHTHSLYASAFAVIGEPVPMVLAESAACLGGPVPVAPFQKSGTPAFAEQVCQTLGNGPAVLWANHGAMVVGATLAQTFSIAHALEDTARIYTIAKQLGTPIILPTQEVSELHEMWLKGYRQKAREPEAF